MDNPLAFTALCVALGATAEEADELLRWFGDQIVPSTPSTIIRAVSDGLVTLRLKGSLLS